MATPNIDEQEFKELQLAFRTGYNNPDASLDKVNEDPFEKLSLHEAKKAVREGQEKRKKQQQDVRDYRKIKYNSENNSLIKS